MNGISRRPLASIKSKAGNAMKEHTLSHQDAKRLWDYCPETGILTWTDAACRKMRGKVAGNCRNGRYLTVRVDGHLYAVHRVVWLWMTGSWPVALIDHKDRDGLNNRWSNLREASVSQNSQNRSDNKNRRLPKGVHLVPYSGRYRARIKINKQAIHLGVFDTVEEAVAVRREAELRHFGEFAPSDIRVSCW